MQTHAHTPTGGASVPAVNINDLPPVAEINTLAKAKQQIEAERAAFRLAMAKGPRPAASTAPAPQKPTAPTAANGPRSAWVPPSERRPSISRAEFDKLSHEDRAQFFREGGRIE